MICYVVTTGWYSDYRIQAVFSTKEAADKYADLLTAAVVEEYDMDPSYVAPPNGYKGYSLSMKENFSVIGEAYVMDSVDFKEGIFKVNWQERSPRNCYEQTYTFNVLARSQEHAIKICSEKLARIIALNDNKLSDELFNKKYDIRQGDSGSNLESPNV